MQYPQEDKDDIERIAAEIINWIMYVQAKYELTNIEIQMSMAVAMLRLGEATVIDEDTPISEILAYPVLDRRH